MSARGLEDPRSIEEIRFFDTASAHVPALSGHPVAWINGYRSSDPCRLWALGEDAEVTSHWQLAILPGPKAQPMAFAFGVSDAGDGRFEGAAGRLVAVSRIANRSVGAAHAPAIATLSVLPDPEPLNALARLVGPVAMRADVPAGWSPARPSEALTEDAVLADLEAANAAFRPGALRVLRLDDGYQRAVGDWETGDGFPHGHRWLTDRIHAAGFQSGLWLAPCLVAEASGIPTAHPQWMVRGGDGEPLVVDRRAAWGGTVFALDATQVPVRDYLRDLARHAVTELGYDLLALDRLEDCVAGARAAEALSGAEAYRGALRALREGAGRAFVAAADAPLQHSVGLVDAMRVGPDAEPGGARRAAQAVTLRAHLHGRAWLNDPGPLAVDDSRSVEEARLWAAVVAFSGGPVLCAGAIGALGAERLDLLKRTLPVAPLLGRAFDVAGAGAASSSVPSWLLGRVADDWWMLAALNWGEAPRRWSFSLADHGIRGPLFVYDVWEERRRPDVDGHVVLTIPPRTSVVLGLRRRRRAPCVIGSTRHVVPGFDVADERWDGKRRILRARAVRLDDRPRVVTIALPADARPRRASSEPATGVTLEAAGGGAERVARLYVPSLSGEAISWRIEF